MSHAPLGSETSLGRIDLQVVSADRSIAFYTDVIGLQLLSHQPYPILGVQGDSDEHPPTELVALHESPSARPQGRTAGIYHFALLFPTRVELANVAARIARTNTPIQGATDHGTHEAIYLPDPDGIGIELAWDRAEDEWPTPAERLSSRIGMRPLDTQSLLAMVPAVDEAPSLAGPGLSIGHLHLHVSDLGSGRRFYEHAIGFEEQMAIPTAAFAAANGYHHHIAFNTWKGDGAPPMDSTATGLRNWTLNVSAPDFASMAERLTEGGYEMSKEKGADHAVVVTDSDGIPVRIQVSQ